MRDDPSRLEEMEREEADARRFGIGVEALRRQRRELGQLLTGPYAGCSPVFASTMELCKQVEDILAQVK